MYIMLSIEATVYADSDDKYSSIFTHFQEEEGKKKRKIIENRDFFFTSVFKYRVKYLQVFRVWYQGVALCKVSCPNTDTLGLEREVSAFWDRVRKGKKKDKSLHRK